MVLKSGLYVMKTTDEFDEFLFWDYSKWELRKLLKVLWGFIAWNKELTQFNNINIERTLEGNYRGKCYVYYSEKHIREEEHYFDTYEDITQGHLIISMAECSNASANDLDYCDDIMEFLEYEIPTLFDKMSSKGKRYPKLSAPQIYPDDTIVILEKTFTLIKECRKNQIVPDEQFIIKHGKVFDKQHNKFLPSNTTCMDVVGLLAYLDAEDEENIREVFK